MIRYHDIRSNYSEFRTNTIKTVSTRKFIDLLKSRHLDDVSSIFEVLGNKGPIRIYLDIEYVPNDRILIRIINQFKDFFERYFKREIGSYVVTKNHYVSKKKLNSYHVIFTKYKFRLFDVRNLVELFVIRFAEFNDFIDLKCYSVDNLFRSIGQYTIDHYNNVRSDNFENYHGIYNLTEGRFYEDNELNDELIEGTIIQGIEHCKEFDVKIPKQSQAIVNILIDYKKNKGCSGKSVLHVKREYEQIQEDLTYLKNFMFTMLFFLVLLLLINFSTFL